MAGRSKPGTLDQIGKFGELLEVRARRVGPSRFDPEIGRGDEQLDEQLGVLVLARASDELIELRVVID